MVLCCSFWNGLGLPEASLQERTNRIAKRLAHTGFPALGGAENNDELVELETEALVGFQRGRWPALKHVPDLDDELAGYSGHGHVARAFARKELPSPLAQDGVIARAKNGPGSLNE